MRPLFTPLLLAALALLFPGCEPWQCDASTCFNGCCDSSGTCIVNGGPSQCGLGGATCDSCQTCTGGVCGCAPGLTLVGGRCVCTPSSCASGCCDQDARGEPVCLLAANQSSSRCGARGSSCTSCTYPSTCGSNGCTSCDRFGESCSAGSCCAGSVCLSNSTFGDYRCGF